MENQNNSEDKRVRKNIRWSIVFVILFAVFAYGSLIWVITEDKKDQAETNAKLLKEQSLNSTCAYKRDSLIKEVKQLSIYKSLTKAMVHRDEATSLLNYKVGDFVLLKRDSARVVISDIIIGGSKFEYYIKYRVLHKDNSTEDVLPELIY
jgi:hypothetical protein